MTQIESDKPKTLDLGVLRTVMASERTLMAWVRTALSLMTFGFTIYKILDALREQGGNLPNENTPRNAGIVLIVMALAVLAMGTLEYSKTRQALRAFGDLKTMYSPTWILAMMTIVAGIILLVIVIKGLI